MNAENAELRARLDAAESEREALATKLEPLTRRATLDDRFLRSIEAFGGTVAESQRSLAALAATLREEKGRVVEASRVTLGNGDVMSRINAELGRLGDGSRHAGSCVNGLGEASRRIADVLTLIRDVAEQTHMLSLNAAIEAARAGTAGRGFSIVADEVRNLAVRTSSATAEIDRLVSRIEQGTDAALTSMSDLDRTASSLASDGAAAARDLDDMRNVSTGMGMALGRSALRAFVELAKVDHLVYKFEVYKVFTGASQKQAGDFASHQRCRLGLWYYEGEGHHCFSRLDGYRDMEAPHLRVHAFGRDAVEAFREGDSEPALDATMRMEEASRSVLACLERMAAAGDANSEALCMVA